MTATEARADEAFADTLNDLLVSTFHSIERFEEQSLRAFEGLDLSVNEAHVIEAVGHGTSGRPLGITVSQVASALSVRVPTATAAVNRLAGKGLVVKERSRSDLRSVHVRLTQKGRRAFRLHALFHRRMVDAVAGAMAPEERAALTSGVRKLKAFFENAANGDAPATAVVHNRGQHAPEGRAPKAPAPTAHAPEEHAPIAPTPTERAPKAQTPTAHALGAYAPTERTHGNDERED